MSNSYHGEIKALREVKDKIMHILNPMVTTFDVALMYIEHFGKPKLYYFNSAFESIVLSGGSIRHHITISLISSYKGYKDFGTWHC